jgi:acetate kinase
VRVLTVNAGSSSLKLALVADGERRADEEISARGDELDTGALARFAERRFDCSSHRIVHGGPRFTAAAVVDDEVRLALGGLVDLAPLHTKLALAALDSVRELAPQCPAVACFDTSFHATLPEPARTYALPWDWIERHGLRRYGFHGLNHGYVARRAAELLERPLSALRIVSCHLGAGASLCAIAGGRSVDTTMGFTPLEGLVMATRSGSVDPGLLLWLERHAGLSADELDDALEHRSGLAGLSGLSGDMKELLAAVDAGDARARLAYDVYIHRLRAQIGAMVAAAGGIDVLVFTGGIGEHSQRVRDDARDGLELLGSAAVLVIEAREDLELAAQASELIGGERR